jgi:ammonia channel protein AmtB
VKFKVLQYATVFLGVVSSSKSCLHTPKSTYIYFYLPFSVCTALVVLSDFVQRVKLNKSIYDMSGMPHLPSTTLIEIVGINEGGRGRSSDEHDVCGSAVLHIDCFVRLRAIQILNGMC